LIIDIYFSGVIASTTIENRLFISFSLARSLGTSIFYEVSSCLVDIYKIGY